MGGLANRGMITGDVTGGGGRSVMPNRDYLNMLAAIRRQGERARRIPTGGGYGGIGYAPPEELPRVPPGGGYSGGVIPRFQGGSKIGGQGAAARARGRGRAPARRQQPWTWVPEEGLWGLPNTGDPGYFYTLKQPGQGGAPAYTPGGGSRGGYSGGVIPRFQSGRTMNPRAGAYAARQRFPTTPPLPSEIGYVVPPPRGWQAGGAMEANPFDDPNFDWDKWNGAGRGYVAPQQTPRQAQMQSYLTGTAPRGGGRGWQGGGRTGTPRASLKAWGYNRPGNPNALTRSTTDEGRRRMYEAMRAGVAPGFGGRGWQAGGQFPEASFPVESELADESPWYPDEEVGFEEAVPTQGGYGS